MNADGQVSVIPADAGAAGAEPVRPTESFYQRNEGAIVGSLSVVFVLAIWQAAWSAGRIDPLFFSGPSAIFARLWDGLFGSGDILEHLAFSAQNFATGFSIAALVAIPLGIVLGWYRLPRLILDPFINGLYSTPRIVFVPLIVIWFGLGFASKAFIVFLSAFFPILLNAMAGVRTTDDELLGAARSFRATQWDLFRTVVLPSTVPFIIVGLRQGLAHGLIGVVVGEFFAGSKGIGYLVGQAGMMFKTDLLFACVVIVAGAGIGISAVLQRVEGYFQSWRPSSN
ncbi:MAG: ABC transporter permease [Alphaproteobacteria bacterium]|nr:ABC transporter permease [Alphaproteobacteria bacterium]